MLNFINCQRNANHYLPTRDGEYSHSPGVRSASTLLLNTCIPRTQLFFSWYKIHLSKCVPIVYIQYRKQNAHSGTICNSSTLETTTQMPINRMDNHRGHPPCSDSEADRRTMGTRMDHAMIRMNLKAYEPKRDKEDRHKSKYSMFQKTKYETRQNRSEESVVWTMVPLGGAPGSHSRCR